MSSTELTGYDEEPPQSDPAWSLPLIIAVACIYAGCILGKSVSVPQPAEFWEKHGVSIATLGAGFLALLVGGLAFHGVIATNRQAATDHLRQRRIEVHSNRISSCWERFTWVASQLAQDADDAISIVTAPVALQMVESLADEAYDLEDRSLTAALTQYHIALSSKFSLAASPTG